MHGYEIIREIRDRTHGRWRPSPGSVYPALRSLRESGLVTEEPLGRKRTVALTDDGRAEAARATPFRPLPQDDGARAATLLRQTHTRLDSAVREVFRAGSAAQQERAAGCLEQVRRRLYTILSTGA